MNAIFVTSDGRPAQLKLGTWLGKPALRIGLPLALVFGPNVLAGEPKSVTSSEGIVAQQQAPQEAQNGALPSAFKLDWYSINNGGRGGASSANFRLGHSVGQPVAGAASSPSFGMGIGFWYGVPVSCAAAKGDMDADGEHTPPDVVLMLGCVFLGSGNCDLCFADVNCDGELTPIDVVLLMNKVFIGNPLPC